MLFLSYLTFREALRLVVLIINFLKIIVLHYRTIPPHLPLTKGGLTPLWKRGARICFCMP